MVVIILVLVALVAILLIKDPWGWRIHSPSPGNEESSVPTYPSYPPGTEPTESLPSVVSPLPELTNETADDIGDVEERAAASPSITPITAEMFANSNQHLGETISLVGTLVTDGKHTEGMLSMVLKTDEDQYANITILDDKKDHQLVKGDRVQVIGIITTEIEMYDDNALSHTGPLISAFDIKKI